MKGNGLALSDDEIFPLTDSFVLYTSHTQMPIMSYHHGPQTLNVFDVIAVDEMISLYFEIALELCLSFKNGRILQKDKVLTCKLQLWPQKGKFF